MTNYYSNPSNFLQNYGCSNNYGGENLDSNSNQGIGLGMGGGGTNLMSSLSSLQNKINSSELYNQNGGSTNFQQYNDNRQSYLAGNQNFNSNAGRLKIWLTIAQQDVKYDTWFDKDKHQDLQSYFLHLANVYKLNDPRSFYLVHEDSPNVLLTSTNQILEGQSYILHKKVQQAQNNGNQGGMTIQEKLAMMSKAGNLYDNSNDDGSLPKSFTSQDRHKLVSTMNEKTQIKEYMSRNGVGNYGQRSNCNNNETKIPIDFNQLKEQNNRTSTMSGLQNQSMENMYAANASNFGQSLLERLEKIREKGQQIQLQFDSVENSQYSNQPQPQFSHKPSQNDMPNRYFNQNGDSTQANTNFSNSGAIFDQLQSLRQKLNDSSRQQQDMYSQSSQYQRNRNSNTSSHTVYDSYEPVQPKRRGRKRGGGTVQQTQFQTYYDNLKLENPEDLKSSLDSLCPPKSQSLTDIRRKAQEQKLGKKFNDDVVPNGLNHITVIQKHKARDPYFDSLDSKTIGNEFDEIQDEIKSILSQATIMGKGSDKKPSDYLKKEIIEEVPLIKSSNTRITELDIESKFIPKGSRAGLKTEEKVYKYNIIPPDEVNKYRKKSEMPFQEPSYKVCESKRFDMQLQGFSPWDDWVPIPIAHKELGYIKFQYQKGDNLIVMTPDFLDFGHNIANITSRNGLILKVKRMMLDRGFRASLQYVKSTKEITTTLLTVNCSRCGKPDINTKYSRYKNQCPFQMVYLRKSGIKFIESRSNYLSQVKLHRKKGSDRPPGLALGSDELMGNDMTEQDTMLNDLNFKDGEMIDEEEEYFRNPDKKFSELIHEIDVPGDPYFLWKFRSFHNHELDTNLIQVSSLIPEKDLHRKGAFVAFPQAYLAIQELLVKRKHEIVQETLKLEQSKLKNADSLRESRIRNMNEGNNHYLDQDMDDELDFGGVKIEQFQNQMTEYKFGARSNSIAKVYLIEPYGFDPCIILVDNTESNDSKDIISKYDYIINMKSDNENKWPPVSSLREQFRKQVIYAYEKVTDQTMLRIKSHQYSLRKYNNMRRNLFPRERAKPILPIKRKNPNGPKKSKVDQLMEVFTRQVGAGSREDKSKDAVGEAAAHLNKHNQGLLYSDDEEYLDDDNYDTYAYGNAGNGAAKRSGGLGGLGDDYYGDGGDDNDIDNEYDVYQ
eukprot:403357715